MLPVPPLNPSARLFVDCEQPVKREAVARDAGPTVPGVTPPHPARKDPRTCFEGLCKRLLLDRTKSDPDYEFKPSPYQQYKFRRFCARVLEHLLGSTDLLDADMSVPHWLAETNYTQVERAHFQELSDELGPYALLMSDRPNANEPMGIFFDGQCFIKSEFYDSGEYKHARWICPVDERARVIIGPYVHALERVVFALPCFVKFIKGPERVPFVMAQCELYGLLRFLTDWTSMESHHTERMDLASWIVAFFYALRSTRDFESAAAFEAADIDRAPGVRRKLTSKHVIAFYVAVLFSGKNRTSVANALLNFLTFWFIMYDRYGLDVCNYNTTDWRKDLAGRLPHVYEGDDSMFTCPPDMAPDRGDYAAIGASVKLATADDPRLIDFISVYIDPEVPCGVGDIASPVARLGWVLDAYLDASSVRLEELMLAKGYSMLYTFRGCPILEPLARYVIRALSHRCLYRFFRKRAKVNRYEFSAYLEAWEHRKEMKTWKCEIADSTRVMVEKLCHVDVAKQLRIEAELNSRTELAPLDMFDRDMFPDSWCSNDADYVVTAATSKTVELPPLRFIDNLGEAWWEAHGDQVEGPWKSGSEAVG